MSKPFTRVRGSLAVLAMVAFMSACSANRSADVVGRKDQLPTGNGLNQNGLTTNGLLNNGFWNNGFWNNALLQNGFWNNGFWNNGFWNNGLFKNGFWNNGFWNNGFWNNGFWNNGLTGADAVPGNILRGNPYARQLLQYIYSCAMPATAYDTTLDPNNGELLCSPSGECELGYSCSAEGTCVIPLQGGGANGSGLGVNGDESTWWGSGKCDDTCQRWVSACVLARTNAYGVKVQISMRAPANAPQAVKDALEVSDVERNGDAENPAFSLLEGAFFGNIFATTPTTPAPCTMGTCDATGPIASTPVYYACAGPGSNIPAITKRFCSSQGDQVIINVPGVCLGTPTQSRVCEGVDDTDPASPTFGAIQDCHTGTGPSGDVYREVITVYIRQPLAVCGNAVCEEGEEGEGCPSDCHPGTWAKKFSPNIANNFVGTPGLGYTEQQYYHDQPGMSAVAPDGSAIAVAGTAVGDVTIDGHLLPAGQGDGVLVKFDANGNYLWGKRFGNTAEANSGGKLQQVNGVTVAPNGDIVVVGVAYELFTQVRAAKIWVSRYSTEGDLIVGSSYSFHAVVLFRYDNVDAFLQLSRSVALDTDGSLVIGGRYSGLSSFGNSEDISRSFIAKLSPAGALVWANILPSTADPSEDLDYGHRTLSIGPDHSVISLDDYFFQKLNGANGVEIWTRHLEHFANAAQVVAARMALAVDRWGDIYVSGYTLNDHSQPSGDLSVPLLEKFNAAGVFQWEATPTISCAFGCSALNNPPKLHGTMVGFGPGDEVVVGAVGSPFPGGSVDFGVGLFPTYTSENIYVAAYSPSGALTWAKQFPVILSNSLLSMSIDTLGYLVVGGTFSGSMQVDDRLLVTPKPEDPAVIDSFLGRFATPSALDTLAPEIGVAQDSTGESLSTMPENIVMPATSPTGTVVFFLPPTAVDEGNAGTSVACSPRPNTKFPIGTTTVTCTASDPRGNPSSASFTITVLDTVGPAFAPKADVITDATSAAGAVVTYTKPVATDQVSGPAAVTCVGPASGSLFPIGRTPISCTAVDAAGNEARTEFAIVVQATGAGLGAACTAAADCASQFCVDGVCCGSVCGGGDPTDCQACSVAAGGGTNGNCTAVFGGAHVCRASTGVCDVAESCNGTSLACPADGFAGAGTICAPAGNTCESPGVCSGTNSTCSAPAPIPSCGPPTFVGVPGTVAAYATSTSGAKVTYTRPTAVSPAGASVPVTCLPASGAQFPLKTTTVNCTASDGMGNTATASFTVKVTYQTPTDASFFLTPLTRSTFFRIGRPVPVRFRLTGASASITNLTATLTVTKISDAVQGTSEGTSDETIDDTDYIFKHRPLLRWYAYRWKTRDQTRGTYRLKADLGDGVSHEIDVSLAAVR